MTDQEKLRMIVHCLKFYANPKNYISQGGTDRVANDSGEMAREVLWLVDEPTNFGR